MLVAQQAGTGGVDYMQHHGAVADMGVFADNGSSYPCTKQTPPRACWALWLSSARWTWRFTHPPVTIGLFSVTLVCIGVLALGGASGSRGDPNILVRHQHHHKVELASHNASGKKIGRLAPIRHAQLV